MRIKNGTYRYFAVRYAIERGQILNQLRESKENTRRALLKEQELNQLKSQFVAIDISENFQSLASELILLIDRDGSLWCAIPSTN